jgi:hypothetical protein
MRRLSLALCGLALSLGCSGPNSTGALWAQQNLEREAALFRLSDAQRAEQATAFEQSLADALLASERARLEADLASCPSAPQPLGVSPGDKVRDVIRLHAQGDAARLDGVAQLALADWRLRRAAETSNIQFCAGARAALSGQTAGATSDLLSGLPTATVTRDPSQTATTLAMDPPSVALSQYALGYVDAVQAPAPLPHYLALVYGGFLVAPNPPMDAESAASMVDAAAPAYPEWEPDGLYAALRVNQA